MDSSLISKLDKARRYADEPGRVSLESMRVEFKGDNDTHTVTAESGAWLCTCRHFQRQRECAHIMAVKYMIERALTVPGQPAHEAHLLSSLG